MIVILRIVLCVYYGNLVPALKNFDSRTAFIIVAVLTALPYIGMFGTYSFMMFHLLGIYHFSMSTGGRHWDKIRPIFIVLNIVVAAVILFFFVWVVFPFKSDTGTVASLASVVMSALCGGLVFGFVLYSLLIFREVKVFRVLFLGLGFGVAFSLESLLWSLPLSISENLFVGLYLGLDVTSICLLLYFFAKSSREMASKSRFRNNNSKNNNNSNTSKTDGIELAQPERIGAVRFASKAQDISRTTHVDLSQTSQSST